MRVPAPVAVPSKAPAVRGSNGSEVVGGRHAGAVVVAERRGQIVPVRHGGAVAPRGTSVLTKSGDVVKTKMPLVLRAVSNAWTIATIANRILGRFIKAALAIGAELVERRQQEARQQVVRIRFQQQSQRRELQQQIARAQREMAIRFEIIAAQIEQNRHEAKRAQEQAQRNEQMRQDYIDSQRPPYWVKLEVDQERLAEQRRQEQQLRQEQQQQTNVAPMIVEGEVVAASNALPAGTTAAQPQEFDLMTEEGQRAASQWANQNFDLVRDSLNINDGNAPANTPANKEAIGRAAAAIAKDPSMAAGGPPTAETESALAVARGRLGTSTEADVAARSGTPGAELATTQGADKSSQSAETSTGPAAIEAAPPSGMTVNDSFGVGLAPPTAQPAATPADNGVGR